jgi:hypothetical protein
MYLLRSEYQNFMKANFLASFAVADDPANVCIPASAGPCVLLLKLLMLQAGGGRHGDTG